MNDLTLLYYTANRLSVGFAHAVRVALVEASTAPIVVVSQGGSPHQELEISADFTNRIARFIYVPLVPPSIWQVYANILLAAKAATTMDVACCEDDTLYAPSHFSYRPAPDIFAYDRNRWVITRRLSADGKRRDAFFYWRQRHQMAMCIAPRELLIETLEERFRTYPEPVSHDFAKRTGFGEPGRYEKNHGLTLRQMEYFESPAPSVTFNHALGLMGRRRVNPDDLICDDLSPWGNANELWRRIHG